MPDEPVEPLIDMPVDKADPAPDIVQSDAEPETAGAPAMIDNPNKPAKKPLWRDLLIGALGGIFGAVIGASATLGGQALNSHWSDARSQHDFVRSTRLDLYKRAAGILTEAETTLGRFSGAVLFTPLENTDLLHSILDGCASITDGMRLSVQSVADEATISAPPDIKNMLNSSYQSYSVFVITCNDLREMTAQPQLRAIDVDAELSRRNARVYCRDFFVLVNKFLRAARDELGFH